VNAWLFVDFFFVLSGFIIGYAYADRLGSWRSTFAFMIRRFGRLWPLHAAVLAPLVGLELVKLILAHSSGLALDRPAFTTENNTLVSVFTNIALVQSLGIHDVLTWNRPSWSISTEFYTYIVFALFLTCVRGALPRLVLPFAIAAVGGAVVLLFSNTGMNTTWDYGIFRCLYGFFIGYLTYRLWRSGLAAALLDRGPWEPVAVALAVGFVWLAGETAWSLAAPFVFAFVVLVFAYERGPVSRLMNVQPIALLGAWSYSIYMINWPLADFLDRGFKFSERFTHVPTMIEKAFPWESNPVELVYIGSRWAMDGLAVIYLLLVIGIAAVTYSVIEQPGRRYFNGLAMRSRTAHGARPIGVRAEGIAPGE
jgi:peptidoglycan/LPS O-acetylase OafA/YrhL